MAAPRSNPSIPNVQEPMQGSHGILEIKTDKILSDEGRLIFEIVNCVLICGVGSLFGISANFINIIIFYKQGFTNTVNIAFLGLAISDLCCLIALEWSSTCMNPLLPIFDVPWVPVEVGYLSAAWPHVCFCRITSYITVYITAERYLCIALPLKVKQIVTPTKTIIILSLIYVINLMTLIPEYATSYPGWRFIPEKNRTLVGIIFRNNRKKAEGISFVIHAIFSTTSFFSVILFTLLLVIKLRKNSKWRQEVSSSHDQIGSSRDRKTVKMIVLIACILIVCYIPGALVSMITFLIGPDFNIAGKYINMAIGAWSIAYSFQGLNSSINIFLYYNMSSKYRDTFHEIITKRLRLCGKCKKQKLTPCDLTKP